MGIRAAVITVSDRCAAGEAEDLSGPALVEMLQRHNAKVVLARTVSDDPGPLIEVLKEISEKGIVNLVLTTGGTGFSPRDNTPEATRAIIEREAPGLAEAMRTRTFEQTPMAMISRGVSGIVGKTLIVNLPGSPKGAIDSLAVIMPVLEHATALLDGGPHSEAPIA